MPDRRWPLAAVLAFIVTVSTASASCDSDVRLQNDVADQYNTLIKQGGCARSGAESAVAISLLQQALEVTGRLQSCPGVSGGTSPAQLREMIDNFGESNEACQEIEDLIADFGKAVDEEQKRLQGNIDMLEKMGEGFATMAAGADAAAAGGAANLKKAAKLYREAARQFGEAGMSEPEKNALAEAEAAELAAKGGSTTLPEAKSKQSSSDEKCKAALTYAEALAASGEDVGAMNETLGKEGCR